ncbi:hypothetical protein ACRRTK_016989 [Alexandromys fortis]
MPTMFTALGSLVTAIWAVLHLRTLLLAVVTFLFLADYLKRRHPKNFPPGPRRLPFIGNLLQLDMEQPHMGIHQHVKKYGNVISLDFGIKSSVIVTSLPLIKEAFTHLEENFMSCPQFPLQNLVFNKNGQPFDPHFKINNAVSNIICSITFGERFEYHDSQFQELLRLLDEATKKVQAEIDRVIGQEKQPSLTDRDAMPYTNAVVHEVQRMANIVPLNVPREVTVDTTLAGFHLPKNKALNFETSRAPPHPTDILFFAEKVHTEIDRVIGRGRQPSTADRESMPYTNAVIHEVQRMSNIIPLNVPREVTADSTVAGFHLRKGTMVLTNLTALHMDPKEWATPDTFNAEHFLENGEFKKRDPFCLSQWPPVNEKLSLKFRMGLTLSPVSHRLCAVPRL